MEWHGWGGLINEIYELRGEGNESRSDVALEAIAGCLRKFVRLAAQNADVEGATDVQKLAELRARRGLVHGRGQVFGHNECCADSLLQLLVAHGFLEHITLEERRVACAANRAALVQHPGQWSGKAGQASSTRSTTCAARETTADPT